MIKILYFLYNIKPVTAIIKEQCALGTMFFIEGTMARLSNWHAKYLKSKGFCEIKELDQDFMRTFNLAISGQNLKKKSLVKIPHDFYFQFFDYILFNRTKKKQIKEMVSKVKMFRQKRANMILELIQYPSNTPDIVKDMSFEECIFYVRCLNAKTDPYKLLDSQINTHFNNEEED